MGTSLASVHLDHPEVAGPGARAHLLKVAALGPEAALRDPELFQPKELPRVPTVFGPSKWVVLGSGFS